MEGVKKITNKILRDAKAETDRISAQAKEQITEIRRRSKERREEYQRRFDERTRLILAHYRQKEFAQARLRTKKLLLEEREGIMDQALADALALRGKRYEAHFLNALASAGIKPARVLCSAADAPLVRRLVKGSKVESAEITGGIIIEGSKGERVDASLGALLKEKREEARQAAAKLLEH